MTSPSWISTTPSQSMAWQGRHQVALPAAIAPNDILVINFGVDGSGGTIVTPSGWTLIRLTTLNLNQQWALFIRLADGSETSPVTVQSSTDPFAHRFAAQTIQIRGARASVVAGTGYDISTGTTSGYGVSVDPDTVTPTWGSADQLYIALAYASARSPGVSGYPTGYSNGAAATAGCTVASSTLAASSSTSNNPDPYTISISANNRAATLVLRPAAAVTVGALVATGSGTANSATTTPPSVAVNAGLATGTGQALYVSVPRVQAATDVVVEWDFDNDGDFDQSVEAITGRVESLSITRGRDYPSQVTGKSRAGEMRLLLDNTDDAFNYFNTRSALNTAPNSLKAGRLIRVRTSTATITDPSVLVRDKFDVTGRLLLDELGSGWDMSTGSWTANQSLAVADGPPVLSTGAVHIATVNAGATTYYAQGVVTSRDTSNQAGIVFHWSDASNYGVFYQGDGVLLIVEVVAGVATTKATVGVENRDHIAMGLAVNGTTVLAYIDGQQVLTTTMGLTPTNKVGIYARWFYQRAPAFEEFWVWDRSRIVQAWESAPAGVLATMRVTKIVPSLANGVKVVEVTAIGDLGLLDRPVTPPTSTGPDDLQSYGVKAGQLIGNTLAKIGALHPPGPIDEGDLTLGAVGFERQQGISFVRRCEETEAGFVYELPEGGIGFDKRTARDASSSVATFSDDTAVFAYRYTTVRQRDWQGDIINDVTSEVSPSLPRYTVFTNYFGNTFPGPLNITLTMPTAGDGAAVGDLFIVCISSTVYTSTVQWINPQGWTMLRQLSGNEKGKQRIYAKRVDSGDLGTSVTFYADTANTGGAYQAIIFLVHNWYGSIEAGVALAEHTGPASTALARAGDNDPPVMFTPWGLGPTLFLAMRAGMQATGSGAAVSASSDDLAPNGFDSMGSVLIDAASGGAAYDVCQQWARRLRTEQIIHPSSFGGAFLNFDYVEATVLAVRGFAGDPPPSSGGKSVHSLNAASQINRNAVLAHPTPGVLFEDDTAALAYNEYILDRYAEDRPILTLGFMASYDARHRALAASIALSDRVTIDADGRAGFGIAADFYVEAISHHIDMGNRRWQTTLDLSPVAELAAVPSNTPAAGAIIGYGQAYDAMVNTVSGISLVGHNKVNYVGSSVTSIDVPLPTQTIVAGDLLEIMVSTQESATASTPNTPSGWTARWTVSSATAFIPKITKFYKIAAGGEQGTSVTVTWPSGTPRPHGASHAFRGVNTTTPYDQTQTSSTGNANPDPASITTVTANAWVVVCCVGNKTGGLSYTLPSGYTVTVDQAANDRSFLNCYKLKAAAGAENPAAYAWAVDNSTVVSDALRPA